MLYKHITPRMEAFFEGLGREVASRPKRWLVLVLAVSLLISVGMLGLTAENKTELLWIPQSSRVFQIREAYIENFGQEASFATLFVQSQEPNGDVFDFDHLEEVLLVTQGILALTVEDEDGSYNYSDLCVREYELGGPCSITNLLATFGTDRAVLKAARDAGTIKATLSVAHATRPLDSIVAGLELNSGGLIQRADATITSFDLSPESAVAGLVLAWQKKFLDFLDAYDFQYISIGMMATRSFDDEISRVVFGDISLFVIALVAMLIYLSATLGFMSWIDSRILLSSGALGILMLSVGASFGMLGLTGVKFNSICILMPFMLLGVGVDDIIVIVDALERVDDFDGIPDRVGKALKHAGTAITLTSITAVLAFFSGSFVDMPGVAAFCVVSSFAFFFNFIFQLVGFTALLALDEERRIGMRHSLLVCIKMGTEEGKTEESKMPAEKIGADLEGEVKGPEPALAVIPLDEDEDESAVRAFVGCAGARQLFNADAAQTSGVTDRVFKAYITPLVLDLRMRVAIMVMFLGLFAGAAASLTSIVVGLPQDAVVPDDSYVKVAFDLLESRWPNRILSTAVILDDMDLTNKTVREEVHDFLDWSAHQDWYVRPTESWLQSFEAYVANPANNMDMDKLDNKPKTFYAALDAFLAGPGQEFQDDILFSDDGMGIVSSRQFLSIKTSPDTAVMFEFMNMLIDRLQEGSLEGKAYQLMWLYAEVDNAIPNLTMMNLIQALMAILVCLCFFIPINKSFVVSFVVTIIDVDILGVMAWWGIRLNAVSFVCLVMSVGLSVDYCVHITHAFEHSTGTAPKRAEQALNTMGVSVMKGGFTTFLGIIILAFASSQAFRTFFKMLFSIVTLGLAHGLIFLPVLLSFVGGSKSSVVPAPAKRRGSPVKEEDIALSKYTMENAPRADKGVTTAVMSVTAISDADMTRTT